VKRYTVPGWPRTLQGHSAVTPGLTRMAGGGAQQYKDGLTGQPGTQAIPVRPVVPSPDIGDLAMSGLSRSSDAPDHFFPNLYYARPERAFWPGAGMPVSVRSDNLMPVPAADPRGIPARLAVPIVQRGRHQVRQPQAMPTWPAWNRS
jgi:hypothetical protein